MVSRKSSEAAVKAPPAQAPVVLSEGAGIALGSVFNRLIKPSATERQAKATGKRPRPEKDSVVLAQSEDVQESLAQDKELRRKLKESKKAKLKFESNALVIPDASTGAALEKELLITATKGAVALFNAVTKAQKGVEEKGASQKKKGPPVSRESFMDMMKAGVNKGTPSKLAVDASSDGSADENEEKPAASKAKWLKDDYLTSGSKKLKDWDKDTPSGAMDSSSDDSDGSNSNEAADDSDSDS